MFIYLAQLHWSLLTKPDWEYQIDLSCRGISEMSDKEGKVPFLANTADVVEEASIAMDTDAPTLEKWL